MFMDRFGIDNRLLQDIVAVLSGNERVEHASVYGSRARGDYRRSSDIDICLYGDNLTARDVNLLQDALEQLRTALRFDVVHYQRLSNPSLKKAIDREGVQIYVNQSGLRKVP
ncbi:nucleotidyltransferase family protein [Kyrpidia tusciae]|uniref:DNA polymerase beta domain protein region n=1 Tax=Kyrpidia tusciae (strain DSM 2912 / NBRC 15312 / T2) TaxID=562970 RepID=D5WW15_KYRT2|nr:nucleotidyltransferase domain-containing protein [Kyrpidia tusciae]ADG05647.1 DNA polymerase beta domain protein region [Kyrpidia tusciae DSM 2912]